MGKKRKRLKEGQAVELGELRSVLTHRRDSQGWALVRDWAEQAWRADREQFDEVWLPYLLGHLAGWPARVCDAPRRWLLQALEPGGFGPLRIARRIHLPELRTFERQVSLLPELAARPEAAGIELLHLNISLSHADVAAMHLPGAWPALRELVVEGHHTNKLLHELLNTPQLGWLEVLSISGLYEQETPERIRCAALPALRHLGLPRLRNASALRWLDALLGETALPALESLELSSTQLAARSTDWERWPPTRAPRLHEIDLTNASQPNHDDLLRAFGPGVDSLNLTKLGSGGPLGDDVLCQWLDKPPHTALKRLSLSHTELGARSIGALRTHKALPALVHLDLSSCRRIGVNAIAQLAKITHMTELRELSLGDCLLNDSAARWLTGWPLLPQLAWLDLRGNTIDRDHIDWLREAGAAELKLLYDDI
jgi:hypothetical protein